MRIGIQLWSVHNEIKEQGLEPILKLISSCGYDSVEFAGFYGKSPDEIKAIMAENNLECFSAHIGLDNIGSSLPYIDALKIKSVYIPSISYANLCGEKFDETVSKLKEAKALLDKRGVKFGYHNHAHEYRDGGDKVYDMLRAVDGFGAQLDTFWAVAGGHCPLELMKKYGDRLYSLHIKEMDERTSISAPEQYPCAIVGTGISKTKEVIDLSKKMGVEDYILEVEGFPCDLETYLAESYAAITDCYFGK